MDLRCPAPSSSRWHVPAASTRCRWRPRVGGMLGARPRDLGGRRRDHRRDDDRDPHGVQTSRMALGGSPRRLEYPAVALLLHRDHQHRGDGPWPRCRSTPRLAGNASSWLGARQVAAGVAGSTLLLRDWSAPALPSRHPLPRRSAAARPWSSSTRTRSPAGRRTSRNLSEREHGARAA